jgi:hypothetical protein
LPILRFPITDNRMPMCQHFSPQPGPSCRPRFGALRADAVDREVAGAGKDERQQGAQQDDRVLDAVALPGRVRVVEEKAPLEVQLPQADGDVDGERRGDPAGEPAEADEQTAGQVQDADENGQRHRRGEASGG